MSPVALYLIFALSTGILAMLAVANPAIRLAKPSDVIRESPWTTRIVVLCTFAAIAPLGLLLIVPDSTCNRLISGLAKVD